MEIRLYYNGRPLEFNFEWADIRKEVSNLTGLPKEKISKYLVKYNPVTNTIVVDEGASIIYAKNACIHENICCGNYGSLAPKTTSEKRRCGLIDKMLIEKMPEQDRAPYRTERLEMYKTLIELNLNPRANDSFREAIKILESLDL